MTTSRLFRFAAALFGVVTASLLSAAEPPPSPARIEGSGAALAEDLRSFRELGSVLQVGAHPDDENTQLIAYFSRGRGYRTAYLSITRGDGGQNEIGPEFGDKLGVARTQELLAARRVDGGRQFFTRAIDFGFSKNPEETLRLWDRDQVLSDVVRVIRKFRPDVIITRFPIPPGSGGHGHHTASAILAVEAFKLAGDPKAYPEQLRQGLAPWQPKRIVWNSWGPGRGPGGAPVLPGPSVQVDIGGDDPVTGEAFGTIANRSRGMHKTQGLGGFSGRTGGGPDPQTFVLLGGAPMTTDLMDGVDVTWDRVAGGGEIARLTDEAVSAFDPRNPAASLPALLAIHAKVHALPAAPLVTEKLRQLDRIVQGCLGLVVETTVPEAEVVAGETLQMRHAATSAVPVRWVAMRYPSLATELKVGADLAAGVETVRVSDEKIPASTPPTQPYWLRAEGTPGMFRVDDPALIGEPENPPVLPVQYVFAVGGESIVLDGEPVQIVAAASAAQAHRRLAVIPPVSLGFVREVGLFAPGAAQTVEVDVTAARAGRHGALRLDAPAGWKVQPASLPFKLALAGEKARVAFRITAPDTTGSAELTASADLGGLRVDTERFVLSYPHLPVELLQRPARFHAVSLDLAIRGQHVGYLPGAGDSVAENLEQMGYAVTRLTGADLTAEKLHGLNAVVIGVRAFNERTDLAANFPGLLAYVEAGGTVVAQYNRPNGLKAEALGPYPLSIAGNASTLRVTDETAPVTLLVPDHPAFTTPNRIVPADFEGWVQERGAYFASSWDAGHYTALLAMNDPGEAPQKGSLLVAKYGRGYYVYTGLSFFRQLPAGTPGAVRLFANLVSLGK